MIVVMLTVVTPSVFILIVVLLALCIFHTEYRYAESCFAESHYAERCYAECHNGE